MHYKAVLFDMDGLLLDSERQYRETFLQGCETFGLSGKEHVFYDCIGLRNADSRKMLEKGLGHLVNLTKFISEWDTRIRHKHAEDMPLKTRFKELLTMLQEGSTLRIVATSIGTENAIQHLQIAGIYDLISDVVSVDQVTYGIPDPEIYFKAADKAGVRVQDCAAFEDSDPGTLAAVRSDATTAQVPDLNQPSDRTRSLGHVIAEDLLSGAKEIGLIQSHLWCAHRGF